MLFPVHEMLLHTQSPPLTPLTSLLLIPWISAKLSLPPGSLPCPSQLGQVPLIGS